MCGRFLLMTSGKNIAEEFGLADFPELFPRYNVAPTQPVLAVRAGATGREAALLRWGLVAPWAKDAKVAPINARAETAADKPMFRHALRKKRCLIPADGFYEWLARAGEKRKQPYCFRPRDERPIAFAGLWERWEGPEGPVESCAILTTEANELVRPVYDRMPVIPLPEQHWVEWLDVRLQDAAAVVPLLRPYPADAMRTHPVGPTIGNPRNDGPSAWGRCGRGGHRLSRPATRPPAQALPEDDWPLTPETKNRVFTRAGRPPAPSSGQTRGGLPGVLRELRRG
jgi:putative SOS response-associated peptidase YedK